MNPRRKIPKIVPAAPEKRERVEAAYDFQYPGASCSTSNNEGPNGTSRMVERVTVTCEPPDYSQESLRVGQESKDEEALPQVCIKEEVVVKEEVQDPLEYLEQFSEEQASWSENNLSSREDLMEGDSRAVCEAIPQVWVKEEIEVKEEVQDPLDYVEETSEDQRSCS
ncbi:uncharacterized protein [Anabrus simplex]|uniref:uncharacterized protein isoform X6 n=1 Tax=Anabrus simplex TaxID=316456 RepID=UPI0035A3C17C